MTIDSIIKRMKELSNDLTDKNAIPRSIAGELRYLSEKLEVAQASCVAEMRAIANTQWISR